MPSASVAIAVNAATLKSRQALLTPVGTLLVQLVAAGVATARGAALEKGSGTGAGRATLVGQAPEEHARVFVQERLTGGARVSHGGLDRLAGGHAGQADALSTVRTTGVRGRRERDDVRAVGVDSTAVPCHSVLRVWTPLGGRSDHVERRRKRDRPRFTVSGVSASVDVAAARLLRGLGSRSRL